MQMASQPSSNSERKQPQKQLKRKILSQRDLNRAHIRRKNTKLNKDKYIIQLNKNTLLDPSHHIIENEKIITIKLKLKIII